MKKSSVSSSLPLIQECSVGGRVTISRVSPCTMDHLPSCRLGRNSEYFSSKVSAIPKQNKSVHPRIPLQGLNKNAGDAEIEQNYQSICYPAACYSAACCSFAPNWKQPHVIPLHVNTTPPSSWSSFHHHHHHHYRQLNKRTTCITTENKVIIPKSRNTNNTKRHETMIINT